MNEEMIQKYWDMALGYAPKVLLAILTLVIGFWIIGIVVRYFRKTLARKGVDESLRPFLTSIISIGLKVALIISVAGMFGVQTASFVAVLGALAFAIGMALQGSLGHFASGVLILLFKPYKVGDLVKIDGHVGVVSEIQVFNTVLMTPDNKMVIIPNGTVTSGSIVNISGPGKIRVDMTFGVSYKENIETVRKVVQSVSDNCPYLLTDIQTDIFISKLDDSSVNFAVRPWSKSEHYWAVYFHFHEELKKAFDRENISIPFPQMDIHLDKTQ